MKLPAVPVAAIIPAAAAVAEKTAVMQHRWWFRGVKEKFRYRLQDGIGCRCGDS